jgi:hypothetical protein
MKAPLERDWENSSPSNLDLSDPRDVFMRRTDCLSGLIAKISVEGMYLGNLSLLRISGFQIQVQHLGRVKAKWWRKRGNLSFSLSALIHTISETGYTPGDEQKGN